MRAFAAGVRHAALPLACLLGVAAPAGGQIAIQVKSGTVWASNIELNVVGPLTFRWRWDGAETPTGAAWQLATVTPTSTATTRASDVIASETAVRVKVAVYDEFTVTPVKTWPEKFYIRMRVNIGKKALFSRWVTVSTVQPRVADLNCAIEGAKARSGSALQLFSGTAPQYKVFGTGQDVNTVEGSKNVGVRVLFRNRLARTTVSYRRSIRMNWRDESRTSLIPILSGDDNDGARVRVLAGGKTDTVAIHLTKEGYMLGEGTIRVEASVTPLSGVGAVCSFTTFIVYIK